MNADHSAYSLSSVTALIIGLVIYLTSTCSYAAVSVPEGSQTGGATSRPAEIPPVVPEPGAPASAPIDVEQKKLPDEKRKAYGAKLFVKEIKISGNTVFSNEELKKITAPYENRIIYNSELEDVRIALTRKYIDQGYINSGAILPDHKVINGVVLINIIEGKLTEFEIIGNKHLNSSYIEERLKKGAASPLNVNALQEQIKIMLESPVIETIKSALRPGDRLGEASLTTLIKEGPRFQFNPGIDNRLSPTLGHERLLLPVIVNDLTGQGDILNAAVSLAEGLTDANVNWSVPLDSDDTILSLAADKSDTKIINGEFKKLNIINHAQTYGFRINHPLTRTTRKKMNISYGLDLRQSESELLGEGFAFTSGVPADGKVKATVFRLAQDWTQRDETQVTAIRSQFSIGLNAFSATINSGDVPSGDFVAWLGQYQWIKLLNNDMGQFIFRSSAQLTPDSLFAMEQYSLGGALSVRGYLENQIVRDTGYNVSFEYRYPLIKDANGKSVLTIAPFFDAGGSKNNKRSNGSDPDSISSFGIGFRWDPSNNIHAEVYWGHANKNLTKKNRDSLQGNGIHFLINANISGW